MPAPILPISPITLPQAILPAGQSGSRGAGGFQDVLSGAIRQVEAVQQNAAQSVERFLSEEGEELHTTILATQQADLSMDLFLQVRNKVVNAYQEIMRMQV
jgi:flagellar hook-basal body complex protein FliE